MLNLNSAVERTETPYTSETLRRRALLDMVQLLLFYAGSGIGGAQLYLPSLYWLKRRRGGMKSRIGFVLLSGLVCNLPVFVILVSLINRKMVLELIERWFSPKP